jgi:predicted short-subunit dehydrogenase-like oxidoreductase (DUF2520 family)
MGGKKKEKKKRTAALYNIKNAAERIEEIPSETEIIILAVSDGEIDNVADEIVSSEMPKGRLVIHLSGSFSIDKLKRISEQGGRIGSLHIMQSFPTTDRVNIKGSYCGIEYDEEGVGVVLRDICHKLELKAFKISSEGKVLYHIAGVFASNFLTGNIFSSENLLRDAGLSKEESENILIPIVESTFRNIEKRGVLNSLSGPAERGDWDVIKNHIFNMRERAKGGNKLYSKLLESYLIQTLGLINLVEEREGDQEGRREMKLFIENQLNQEIKEREGK